MADERDDSQKTEEPTQKRLQESEDKGDVAQSPEVAAWFVLAAATGFVAIWGSTTASGLKDMMTAFLAQPHALALNTKTASGLVRGIGFDLFTVLAAPFALLLIVGVGSHWIQHPPVFSAEKLKPNLNKLSPIKGFNKLFGKMALVNFVKGIVKTGLASVAIAMVLWPARDQLLALIALPVSELLPLVQALIVKVLLAVLAILAVVAVADYAWQHFERMRRLKMTRQELKDEYKQSEGDPIVKGRLRQIRSERARKRMMAAVPKASVIITNPTHYAVALRYESGNMDAPICVAKGVDHIALKIRELGAEHQVPIVENPPLARSLYATVEVDETIKPEHYKAVAQVIGYVMRLKNKAKPRPRP